MKLGCHRQVVRKQHECINTLEAAPWVLDSPAELVLYQVVPVYSLSEPVLSSLTLNFRSETLFTHRTFSWETECDSRFPSEWTGFEFICSHQRFGLYVQSVWGGQSLWHNQFRTLHSILQAPLHGRMA